MSKTIKESPVDLEKSIMAKVKSNQISMKPKWYFVIGSVLAVVGLASFSIAAAFLMNLTFFLLRHHGPMGEWRLQQLLTSFPLWIPALAIVGIVLGIWLLRKYDFSYKQNFWQIVLGFIISIILAAVITDQLGLNDIWSKRGPMRRFYQQIETPNLTFPRGPGNGRNR